MFLTNENEMYSHLVNTEFTVTAKRKREHKMYSFMQMWCDSKHSKW